MGIGGMPMDFSEAPMAFAKPPMRFGEAPMVFGEPSIRRPRAFPGTAGVSPAHARGFEVDGDPGAARALAGAARGYARATRALA
jgi:hypothetical protein